MKVNKTVFGVLLFIVVLVLAGYSAKSKAEQSASVGVGHSLINSHLKVGMVGYQYNGWELNARLMEAGDTKNGEQDQLETYSVSYLTKPAWGYKGIDPYLRLGVSKNSGSELVGSSNFMLGVGVSFHEIFRLEFIHDSSAGIHQTNSGIDQVVLSYVFDAPWE